MEAMVARMAGEMILVGAAMLTLVIMAAREWQREENEKRRLLEQRMAENNYWFDPEGE